jgi:hypothetical protein
MIEVGLLIVNTFKCFGLEFKQTNYNSFEDVIEIKVTVPKDSEIKHSNGNIMAGKFLAKLLRDKIRERGVNCRVSYKERDETWNEFKYKKMRKEIYGV